MAGRDLDNDRGRRADEYEAYLSRGHARSKDRLSIGGYAMNSVKRGHVSHKWP